MLSGITIRTNHHVRQSLCYYELNSRQERAVNSAYGGLIAVEDGEYVFYHGWPYLMADCLRTSAFGPYWNGCFDGTFSSCVLVHIVDDEGYVFGTAFE